LSHKHQASANYSGKAEDPALWTEHENTVSKVKRQQWGCQLLLLSLPYYHKYPWVSLVYRNNGYF